MTPPSPSTTPATALPVSSRTRNRQLMERVLFNLHLKVCTFGLRKTSFRLRSFLEHLLLVLAVCGFGALILLHVSFVYRQHRTTAAASSTTASSFQPSSVMTESFNAKENVATKCLQSIPGFQKLNMVDLTHLVVLPSSSPKHSPDSQEEAPGTNPHQPFSFVLRSNATSEWIENDLNFHYRNVSPPENLSLELLEENIYYSFATVKGYLVLPSDNQLRKQLDAQYVVVSPSDGHCFGEPFLQKLVWNFIGPDTVMLNWVLSQQVPGVLMNPRNAVLHEINPPLDGLQQQGKDSVESDGSGGEKKASHRRRIDRKLWDILRMIPQKLAVVIQTCFLFFSTTTLVSFTLRETQEHMLDFTHQLSILVNRNLPLQQLITTHLLQNMIFLPIMVGMMFFLIECYHGDKFLAFLVMTIVWVSEVFSVISLRSVQGIIFFPRMFFLLFCLFHFYHCASPFGFGYLALATVACFMVHSMVFFWHRYELPAVALGWVTIENPRQVSRYDDDPEAYDIQIRSMFTDSTTLLDSSSLFSNRQNSLSSMEEEESSSANNHDPNIHIEHQEYLIEGALNVLRRSLPSFSTVSSSVYQNRGSGNGADEDDDSYQYMLGGEVMIHRGEQQSRSSGAHTQDVDDTPVRSGSRRPEDDSMDHGNGNLLQPITTNNSVGPAESRHPPTETAMSSIKSTRTRVTGADTAERSSGSQTILNVRLDPRPNSNGNASNASALPPKFPQLNR